MLCLCNLLDVPCDLQTMLYVLKSVLDKSKNT